MNRTITLNTNPTLRERIGHLNWGLVFLIFCIAGIGFVALYSAAGGNMSSWPSRQAVRFGVGVIGMLVIALIDVRWWYRLAWPAYIGCFALLLGVEVMGHVGMGAQRWIDLGIIRLQPSELMKIAVIMVLARQFHSASLEDMRRITFLIIPAITVLVPVLLVMGQPDLGTSLMIVMGGGAMLFMAGASLWLFGAAAAFVVVAVPLAYHFLLHDYQKARVMTFLNPESDPLGAGYHITQAKIALGSGGIEGKGFMQGSQSHLNFLPEKQTDFIFTLWAEEFGFLGGMFLLALFGAVFMYGLWIANVCRHNFGRYLAAGLTVNFSLYVLINVGMVTGLLPVVGVPLPLVSYGGTAMLAALASFGLIMSCSLYRDSKMSVGF